MPDLPDWQSYVIVVLVGTLGSLLVKGKFWRPGSLSSEDDSVLRDVKEALSRIDRETHDTKQSVTKCHEQADVILRKIDRLGDQNSALAKQLIELHATLTVILRTINGRKDQ